MKERQRWQPEEDALLRAYVRQYGAKEWNLISHRMGRSLDRDPKSCLERWKNYLRPGIKKGSLSLEEQNLVISLQAKYGNKWKKIASELPGRTAKRLGKWWEVFREKQLKQLHKNPHLRHDTATATATSDSPSSSASPDHAGKYDHILETFAEKYVHVHQPKLLAFQPIPLPVMPNLSLPDPPPVLSLGSVALPDAVVPVVCSAAPSPVPVLPPWMSGTAMGSTASSVSSSSTPSPSVSLSLSPSEPAVVLDPEASRLAPVQQMATLMQYCKELEEGRQSWVQHKKEATWRLSRLEQQLDSEKSRKRREKIEEIEGKIRCLREEEMAHLGRIENDYREQLMAVQRDAESKETKLIEAWSSKHMKLAKIMEKIGIHNPSQAFTLPKDLH